MQMALCIKKLSIGKRPPVTPDPAEKHDPYHQVPNKSLYPLPHPTHYTSLTVPAVAPAFCPSVVEARKLRFPILCTILLPTASTAPIGFIRLGPFAASFSTLKSRIEVLFQTPAAPFWTAISEEKMKLQSKDSYQPRESGDHSKRWMRAGDGSMEEGRFVGGVVVSVLERRVSIVWRGRVCSHESTLRILAVRSISEFHNVSQLPIEVRA